jgi:hypothetical protein
MKKNIYISFIEEGIMHPDYWGYVAGRIEVHRPEDKGYHSEEIRFFTDEREKFEAFRDEYDMKEVSEDELKAIEKVVQLYFMRP